MSITKDMLLTINGDKSNLSAPLSVYFGDRGIDIFFEIKDIGYNFSGNVLENLDNSTVSTIIKKPNGNVYRTTKASVTNKKVKFTITREITDELSEIGFYDLQFQFYDAETGRITIPPIQFEVKELLAPIDDDAITNGQINYGMVDEIKVSPKEGEKVLAAWVAGEFITANKLNAMVEAIQHLNDMFLQYGTHESLPVNPKEYMKYYDTTIKKELTYISGNWYDNDGFVVDEVINPIN